MRLADIKTHVIAGPLGAGKTTLIRQLFAQRPAHERWAILVNEFGQVGLDAALMTRDDAGLSIAEVPGGCLCCVQGVPLQVALTRLLRRARPQRLFIEPSGLGHPASLYRQLQAPPWTGVLTLQPLIWVVDAGQLLADQALPEAQQQALEQAGLIVLNKSAGLDRTDVPAQLGDRPLYWTEGGRITLAELPLVDCETSADHELPEPMAASSPQALLLPGRPLRFSHTQEGHHAVGWRWHPSHRFDGPALLGLLGGLPGLLRLKAVLQLADGWQAYNGVAGQGDWESTLWRRDNRLELILDEMPDLEALEKGLRGTIRDI
ncbi:CobW-like GTP-binding protein [Pseudomonas sp. Snoq117.2]|uniref:CobW-like GTP-binding protein n=1 Tax=Pseudomonas sp. Snoq117.2 TaxID=1500302 RepID=UPI0008BCF92E|nr:CobW-like GTP-binding protein [Pseudomonas sp. Snoq117.2]SEP04446.1 GTPase, G3E family [Pseudomonas sp. Snoq117.2]